jgi:hypothetical protein
MQFTDEESGTLYRSLKRAIQRGQVRVETDVDLVIDAWVVRRPSDCCSTMLRFRESLRTHWLIWCCQDAHRLRLGELGGR